MANVSGNPSSPPKESTPTPSTTPSTTPIYKKGRFKILACKVVAGEEQSKKINEQLKASQEDEPKKSEDSFKYATEREETVSSEIEQVISGPKITSEVISEVAANLENRFVLVGTVASVETTEYGKIGGVIVVWSEESDGEEECVREKGGSGLGEATEGLVRLRKRFQEPVLSVQEPLENLSRRVSDMTLPTRGRDTRSQKKQSETELEKALKESKRKVAAKEKKKVSEPVEAVEIEEMDLVLHDKEEAEEVEVVTPKVKKIKTSTKKSALKSRKVKVVEEEESEEEEESDAEKDKMVKFRKRTILKGRPLRDLEEEGMMLLLEKLQLQGWKNMVLQMDGKLARTEILEFMANCEIKNDRVTSVVKGVTVSFDYKELGEILGVPAKGYNDYKKLKWPRLENLPTSLAITRKFGDNEEELQPKTIYKSEIKPPHKVLFEFVNKVVLPRQERRHIATFMDLVLMECFDSGRQINWYEFIIQLLDRVLTGTKTHAIPYGFILTARLKKRLAEVETERDALRTKLAMEKEKNEGILHDMLKLLQAKNQEPSPSQP
ncbi:uncharacterized protein [Nicotiana tomentosiformis]|uniref:uncharacterized protein n=1 Tax=Nicotiana tomentosiformis TaxID=4098 RepID=UPI00388CA5D4